MTTTQQNYRRHLPQSGVHGGIINVDKCFFNFRVSLCAVYIPRTHRLRRFNFQLLLVPQPPPSLSSSSLPSGSVRTPQGRRIVPHRPSIQPPKNSATPSVDLNPAIHPRAPVVTLLGCCFNLELSRPLLLGSSAETTQHHCHSPPTATTLGGKRLLELRSALGGGGTREDSQTVSPGPFRRTPTGVPLTNLFDSCVELLLLLG